MSFALAINVVWISFVLGLGYLAHRKEPGEGHVKTAVMLVLALLALMAVKVGASVLWG